MSLAVTARCSESEKSSNRRMRPKLVSYAFANRQVIAHHTHKAFEKALGISAAEVGLRSVYEVSIIRLQTTSTKSQCFCL